MNMGYKVLATLDLPNVTDDQRDVFYEILKKKHWSKIAGLTTSWKISFNDNATRDQAVATLKNHLQQAKLESKIKKVEYAMQMDKQDVIISAL